MNSQTIEFHENETIIYNYNDFGIKSNVTSKGITYDTTELTSMLESLNANRSDETLPSLIDVDNKICFIPYDSGNRFDVKAVYDYIVSHINDETIVVNLSEFYIYKPNSELHELSKRYEDEYNKFMNSGVTYTNGAVLSLKLLDLEYDIVSLVDDKLVIHDTAKEIIRTSVDATLATILPHYDSVGKEMMFETMDGRSLSIGGGSWGNKVDHVAESEYVIEAICNMECIVNHMPIFEIEYGYEIPDTYVEVDLDAQHVWYYEDGELIMDSNCITGKKNKHDTPTGAYYMTMHTNGKYLHGPTWHVWVDKWMRFTDRGHGLHDAQWRKTSEFEPERYTWDGSHGCINLPKQFAYDLFDKVDVGTCVVIYDSSCPMVEGEY